MPPLNGVFSNISRRARGVLNTADFRGWSGQAKGIYNAEAAASARTTARSIKSSVADTVSSGLDISASQLHGLGKAVTDGYLKPAAGIAKSFATGPGGSARLQATAGGLFVAGTAARWATGNGGMFRDGKGNFDIAGIPFI